MLQLFNDHLKNNFSELFQSKLLIAVSGGLDSVVLARLCHELELDIALAHCNFNLRATESDADAIFVERLAEDLNAAFHLESFDTKTYASDNQTSIQLAARELRYQWFAELAEKFDYNFILTAHHLNDVVETFIINLSRGTGLDGLTGIPERNKNIIRPLLTFSRENILALALQKKWSWREDSSNASDTYIRNAIRHNMLPKLEELNSSFLQNFKTTQKNLKQTASLLEDYTQLLVKDLVTETSEGYEISVNRLLKHKNYEAILYQLLKDFNFKDWSAICTLLSAQTGKFCSSDTHRIIKNRDVLLLTTLASATVPAIIIPKETSYLRFLDGALSIEPVEAMTTMEKHIIYVDAQLLLYPLTLRPWKDGDSFRPFGMKGSKKLSDFFKDEKLSLPQKEQSYVLTSNGKIVWVVGWRADDRFKVTTGTKNIIKIIWHP